MGDVGVDAVIADAENRARQLLGHGAARWRHSVGVAKAATEVASTVGREDAELLVAAAWLHDIGYAAELVDTGFHPLDGARYVRSLGGSDRLCRLVANHTAAWVEAEARGLAETLAAEFPVEQSPVADALTYADLTTSPVGELVTSEDRLAEILDRYPPEHVVHRSIRRASAGLIATVFRVEARRAVHTVRPTVLVVVAS